MSVFPWQPKPSYEETISKILDIAESYPNDPELQELADNFRPTKEVERWFLAQDKKLDALDSKCAFELSEVELNQEQRQAREQWHKIMSDIKIYTRRYDL